MKALNPYLNFDGNAREAMEFYKEHLGGELFVMTFGEANATQDESAKARLMHANLALPHGARLMASDTMPGMAYSAGNNFWLSVSCDTSEEVDRLFKGLGVSGKGNMEPQETFWAHRFAMTTDKFGNNWMFSCDKPTSV
jgi:PhnB protein